MIDKVVLVIGSCGLDRLLTVPTYPSADAKVQTTAYHEMGGGNAANTASAMALLSKASFLPHNITVKLCTKVGDDFIGKQIIQELVAAGVDLSSPLFRIGEKSTTTGFTSVIVSDREQTRTCINTPGTCGELTISDLKDVDLDIVFQNVVHLHSDARHTDVALILGKEARKRGIPVSLDVEKDRGTKALDELLCEANTIFTNAGQIEEYLSRLTSELEEANRVKPLKEPTVVPEGDANGEEHLFAESIGPGSFFSRWYKQQGKVVVITKGDRGALHVTCDGIADGKSSSAASSNEVHVSVAGDGPVQVTHSFVDCSDNGQSTLISAKYTIHHAGVVPFINVVDTTGAGDAFIGGYILATLANLDVDSCLRLGCWVSGQKLAGPGARSALPSAVDADSSLGLDLDSVAATLQTTISSFRRRS